tara:strand:+ start:1241 stop:1426 length:186 start_codon:yes stop_codon:yes gene_type:complete
MENKTQAREDIGKLKQLPSSHRFIFVKDLSTERLNDVADELYLDYDEHDDVQSRVLQYFNN